MLGAVYSPTYIPRFSIEANWYKIKVDDAIQAINANTTLQQCVFNNDPGACANVNRTASGQIANISGLLQNIASIKTEGLDLNLAYRTDQTSIGRFGFTWNNTFLMNYDIFVPAVDGTEKISREGTEQGSPDQAFPKWKAIGTIDWDLASFGASASRARRDGRAGGRAAPSGPSRSARPASCRRLSRPRRPAGSRRR